MSPLPTPNKGESQSDFIARCMGSDVMQKEYPDQKQRSAVAYSQWRKHSGKKESMFTHVFGYETKEGDDLIKYGYIATTHLDTGQFNEEKGKFVRDKISLNTLEKWKEEINSGNPRANKVSVNHNREPHVTGVGVKGTAKIDRFSDGEYGLWVGTLIDKTKDTFQDVSYRIDKGLLDSYSIEYDTGILSQGSYYDGAVAEHDTGKYIVRELLPNTILDGWTLASQPMNENCVMLKEIQRYEEEKKETIQSISKEEKTMVETMTEPVVAAVEQKQVSDDDFKLLSKYRELEAKEAKEIEMKSMVSKIMEQLKTELQSMKVENKVILNKGFESKEIKEYRDIFESKGEMLANGQVRYKTSVKEQFFAAGRLAGVKGLITSDGYWKRSERKSIASKGFGVNGNLMEFKGLGLTTNQNTDTDYLLSAAELADVFDPVIYNALNQKTVAWNIIEKDDYSFKGNDQVSFKLKTAANPTTIFYLGNAVNVSSGTRVKYQTKFKKVQVGVEVDGDMIAAARGGPHTDVFALEVQSSTDDLMVEMNKKLFGTGGAETDATPIGFEYICDSATYTSLYNVTRSSANKLAPTAAGDTAINGASVDITLKNLRAAARQVKTEGADPTRCVWFTSFTQEDKFKSKYDSQQRTIPTSSRFGFEGRPEFEGIPIFADKDCNSDDWFLVDLETHRIGIWVPPTLEMLGKDSDSEKGFIKVYFATYNLKPRAMVWIYGNATT